MNRGEAAAEFRGGAWRAMVRFPHKSGFVPVMKDGKLQSYPTAKDARLAAADRLIGFYNTEMRREGERLSAAKAKAELLFRPGKRPVPIERKVRA